MAGKLSLSVRAVEKSLRELKKMGIVIRYGSTKSGHWEINKHSFQSDNSFFFFLSKYSRKGNAAMNHFNIVAQTNLNRKT